MNILKKTADGLRDTYDYHPICDGYCGPAAISFVAKKDPDEVGKAMDWQHEHAIGGVREDLQDSPYNHFSAVVKLGKQWNIKSCHDIVEGRAVPDKTIVLIRPDARNPTLVQHWVVFAGLDAAGNVLLHWGDGTVVPKGQQEFQEMYARGINLVAPPCAYEIVESGGHTKLTWYMRLYVWWFGCFA